MSNLFSTTAYAADGDTVATQQPSFVESMIPFVLIFAAMYFIIIRPQTKKAKDHQDLLKSLKTGDEVVTSGGIIGRVKNISDTFIVLDVGSTAFKVLKEHISHISKKPKAKA